MFRNVPLCGLHCVPYSQSLGVTIAAIEGEMSYNATLYP